MMWIFSLIIGYILYIGIKDNYSDQKHVSNQPKAKEVLKTKLVEGEITEEEYFRRKKIIESK